MKIKSESHSDMSNSLQHHGLQPSRFLYPWNSPGNNTGVGSHSLQQRILTQGLNTGLLYCRRILYHLSHKESIYIYIYIYICFIYVYMLYIVSINVLYIIYMYIYMCVCVCVCIVYMNAFPSTSLLFWNTSRMNHSPKSRFYS